MLEKIGLPAKPSQRGCNWVVDASHCQGCSSQFTFINRKHHCRRCGGLFCGSCTQQRMVLRGQGDSPVRICEPCKKLEEAARFERRHGQKSKAGRGDLKLASKFENETLNQIISNDVKDSLSSGGEPTINSVSSSLRATSSASCSSVQQVFTQDGGEEILRSLSVSEPNNVLGEMGSANPEELRQQALDERKRYKILKSERKPDEALKAFKRAKELERQASSVEVYLRKSRKKALSSSNMTEIQKIKDDPNKIDIKINRSSLMGKEKDDLASELRELGWSDMDLGDADKKPASISLEGELYTLIGEVPQRSTTHKGTRAIDKTEVIAMKKKALMLKREGNLAEAKEELKRAKILEKQLEEQEFLADAEDSDDELSALIRSTESDNQGDLSMPEPGFDFDHLTVIADDVGVDSNFEVTDDDMYDPEIAAALQSLGWAEDTPEEVTAPESAPIDREALLSEIQSLKREALAKKRAGNAAEAMALLKKAKLLEKDLDSLDSQVDNLLAHDSKILQKGSITQAIEKPSKSNGMEDVVSRPAKKSKLMIQRELLALKKRALALRKEGRLDESEEELKKGKVLEQQLEEMDNASNVKGTPGSVPNSHPVTSTTMDLNDGEGEEDVTDQDLHDPTYISLLSNLGWKEEDNDTTKPSKQNDSLPAQITDSYSSNTRASSRRRSKGEIQRELLGLKRKALSLRREGQTEEADEVLRKAKELESEIEEMEGPKQEIPIESNKPTENEVLEKSPEEEDNSKLGTSQIDVSTSTPNVIQKVAKPLSSRERFKLQQESLAHKRQALKLRKEGRTEEADAEFKLAKDLEARLEESAGTAKPSDSVDGVGVEDLLDPQLRSALKAIGIEDGGSVSRSPEKSEPVKAVVGNSGNPSQERIQLEEQIKAEKVKAVQLKRVGKKTEALDALRQAKLLEKKLSSLVSS